MSIRQLPRLTSGNDPDETMRWAARFGDMITNILNAPSQNGLVGIDQFRAVASASGHVRLPSTAAALQLSWGTDAIAAAGTTKAVTFETAFPRNCWVVILSQTGTGGPFAFCSASLAKTGFTATANNAGTACSFFYIAIGN